jgi:hypothetical protein
MKTKLYFSTADSLAKWKIRKQSLIFRTEVIMILLADVFLQQVSCCIRPSHKKLVTQ